MLCQCPADHPARVRVQQHCDVDKLLSQSHVSDIGYPEFIEVARYQPTRQIRPHSPSMLRIGGRRHEPPRAQTEQIVFAHQAQHAFRIHPLPALPQFLLHPPVSVEPLFHDPLLDGIAQRRVGLAWCRRFPMPIKPRPADAAQLAHSFHAEAALPGPLRDQRADRFAPTLYAARLRRKNPVPVPAAPPRVPVPQSASALPATPHVRISRPVRSYLQTLPFAAFLLADAPGRLRPTLRSGLSTHTAASAECRAPAPLLLRFPQPTPGAPLLAFTPFHTPADSCSFVT